ncbi:jg23828 [Pararge aegeria aegeria]|uniref:Jg23828 protein n=1 Tax=Pararge aegeria aegeria TaxID=348720 RepID=A0A8S4QG28_9NEOP|nr:jg23828 [Pararge aegeria aegeria]
MLRLSSGHSVQLRFWAVPNSTILGRLFPAAPRDSLDALSIHEHCIKVSKSLGHYDYIVRSLSDVLAVNVDAKPVPTQKLKKSSNAALYSFGEITISLSHSSL